MNIKSHSLIDTTVKTQRTEQTSSRSSLKARNFTTPEVVEYRIIGLVFYTIIFLIGTVVNVTALWVFCLTTRKKTSTTIYMINVAILDLIVILFLPFRLVYYSQDYWPFGDSLCRVSAALSVFYPSVALWLFVLIGIDRYVALMQPRHAGDLKKIHRAILSCVGLWIMALGVDAPLLLTKDSPDRASNLSTCTKLGDAVYLKQENLVNFVRFVFFFLVPICIVTGCYTTILRSLLCGQSSKIKAKVKKTSIRIVVVVMVQVLVCFVPFHICFIVQLLELGTDPYRVWAMASSFMLNLSTVLDIILYYITSQHFKERVISVILYRNYLRSRRRKVHQSQRAPSALL
ncbi:hypothetical protein Z043-101776 [Arapaima gigas]